MRLWAANLQGCPLWKCVVGPGVVPLRGDFNNLQCQTSLTALTGANGIFLCCQTEIVTKPRPVCCPCTNDVSADASTSALRLTFTGLLRSAAPGLLSPVAGSICR